MRQFFLILSLMSINALAISANTFCACCVDRGYYEAKREKPDAFRRGLLGELKFDTRAELYMTQGGFDAVKGLPGMQSEVSPEGRFEFNIVESFVNRLWTLELTTRSGKKGTLKLPMPAYMSLLKIDTREQEFGDRGLGVSLYKQFEFTGRVQSGTGLFRSAASRPATYSLIFQGRGNGCDNAADFHHWRLELNGATAGFAILGKLDVAGT